MPREWSSAEEIDEIMLALALAAPPGGDEQRREILDLEARAGIAADKRRVRELLADAAHVRAEGERRGDEDQAHAAAACSRESATSTTPSEGALAAAHARWSSTHPLPREHG